MQLEYQIARVTIADDAFYSSDGILMSDILIEIGENQRSSICSFSVYDPDLKIGARYQKMSIKSGGILVPNNLLNPPQTSIAGTATGGSVDTSSGVLQASGGGTVEQNIKLIIAECQKQGVTNVKQIAYILATVQHESGYRPIDEIDGSLMRYAPYFGRGFVQLTNKDNYEKYSKILGQDFVNNPNGVKTPTVAAFILVHGMRTGTFTGAKLDDYINSTTTDYYNARTIVNSHDRADLIAGYAQEWEKKLPAYLGATAIQNVANTSTNINPTVKAPDIENSVKGTEIIIEVGFSSTKKLTSFHFIHTETITIKGDKNITSFKGQSIRWLLTRVPETTAYQNINLRQISEIFTKSYGLNLKMEGNGLDYIHLDQTGLTPFQLLSREAGKIGYKISDDKNNLVLEPEARPKFSNFLVDETTFISIKFADKARGSIPSFYQAISDPYSNTYDTKFVIDRQTGTVKQDKPENFSGTTQKLNSIPSQTPNLIINPSNQSSNQTPNQSSNQSLNQTPSITTGSATSSTPGIMQSNNNYGLPKQIPGVIALKDGRAEGQIIANEAKRIKGYESVCELYTTDEVLQIVPGEIIALASSLFPDPFDREWRVYSVSHDWKKRVSTLTIYTPQGISDPNYLLNGNPSGDLLNTGAINNKLYQSALKLRGSSTANDGSGGRLACVYAVNNVFINAGLTPPWGSAANVPTAESALQSSAISVPLNQVQPGDIAIFNNQAHIGIVTGAGGSKILSNSTSNAAFSWEQSNADYERYYGGATHFYRIKK